MSYLVREYWLADGSGVTRRDRRGCEYEAYVPDILIGRPFAFDGDVAADVADAEAAVRRLNATAPVLANTEALARLLLRAEAVASSRIEGLEIGPRRLLEAEAAGALGMQRSADVTAEEVLGNIRSMNEALAWAGSEGRVSIDTILGIHRVLLSGTRIDDHAGRIRAVQNWIGGSGYNPCSAAYVPPPPMEVERLLEDLAEFCNDDSLPALAQAAIAHAQFETIHPFVDGNGRTGRALTHLILRRRGLAPAVVPPVSLVLATLHADYVAGLTATRYAGEPGSAEAVAGINRWVAFFAGCCLRAVQDAEQFEARIDALKTGWRRRVGRVRRNSSVDLLIDLLPGCPIVTVGTAAELLGRSFRVSNLAIEKLAEAGVLTQVKLGRRNRVFEAAEAIDEFTRLERRLASPVADTMAAAPSRRVPSRR